MRVSVVSLLLAGGLLALGSGAATAQSSTDVQGTANAHIRQNAALDRELRRTLPRPRASSAFRSCEDLGPRVASEVQTPRARVRTGCRGALGPAPRERQRAYLNRAIDQSLNSGR